MVFCSGWAVMVARNSADWWQHIACNPERLDSGEVLHLLCCLPLHHFSRLVLCLFSFFCIPYDSTRRRQYRIHSYYQSSSSSSDDSESDDDGSHSD